MIRINDIVITEEQTHLGIQWSDGEQSWDFGDLEDEEIRDIAWSSPGATLLKRKVFFTAGEVAE